MRDALHPAHPRRQAGSLLDGDGNLDPGENPRLHDAAGEGRRPQRALDRHRHHRGGGVGRRRQDRGASRCIACWPSASTAAASPTRCSAMSAAAGTGRARPSRDLQDEMRRHLDAGYTMVKMKVGGLPLADDVQRVEAVKSILPAHARARGRCQLQVRPRRGARLCEGARAVRAALVRGAVRSARLRAAGGDRERLRRRRSRPARTCSRRRTSRTWCASAASSPSAAT